MKGREPPLRSLSLLALLVFCGASYLGASPSGAKAQSLENDIRWIVTHDHGFRLENVGITAMDQRGRLLVSLNASTPLKPASNMKIITTAAALHFLGADYRFETFLLSTAALEEGEIRGDLILRGNGDPNISGEFYDGDVTALLRRWARELHRHGLRRVSGDLIADDSFFDAERFLPTWDRAQEGRSYAAQISPVTLNDNCVDVTVTPAANVGGAARVTIVPASSAVRLRGVVRTVAGRRAQVRLHRKTGSNELSLAGKIGSRADPLLDRVTIDDPALFFATVLSEVLLEEGISLGGRVRRVGAGEGFYEDASRRSQGALDSRPGESVLVRHTSSLRQALPLINKESRNLHAELLLKTLGARVAGRGSVEGGWLAIRKFLEAHRLAARGLEVHDGSGLSHSNRVSAALLTDVLHAISAAPYFGPFRDSLAVAGVDGTLAKRFRRRPELRGRVFAKTGSIKGVSCVSGYLTHGSKTWCFSILVNGFPKGAKAPTGLQEHVLARLDQAMR